MFLNFHLETSWFHTFYWHQEVHSVQLLLMASIIINICLPFLCKKTLFYLLRNNHRNRCQIYFFYLNISLTLSVFCSLFLIFPFLYHIVVPHNNFSFKYSSIPSTISLFYNLLYKSKILALCASAYLPQFHSFIVSFTTLKFQLFVLLFLLHHSWFTFSIFFKYSMNVCLTGLAFHHHSCVASQIFLSITTAVLSTFKYGFHPIEHF